MKKLLAAILALALFAFALEVGTVPVHEPSWQIAAAVAAAPIPALSGAFTIAEFCKAHRISTAFYYVMKGEGWGPAEMHAGQRVLISHEAAAEWRRAREAAAVAGVRRNLKTENPTEAA
jgi:hypothetical protein